MSETATATLTDFLGALHPPGSGWTELRALPSRAQRFVRSADAAEHFLQTHGDENLYFGVALRRTDSGGSLANCGELHALFADVDFKVTREPEARERLESFPLKPSIVVNSGGGLHFYYLLREPLDLQTPEDCQRAKNLLRRLALALDGDLSSAEPARILRVPGTLNHKPEYGTPRPVAMEHFSPDLQYNPSDIDDLLPKEPEASNANGHESRADWLALLRGVKAGDRHGTAARLAGHYLGLGRPVEEVEAMMLGFLAQCDPPGDREKQAELRRMVREFAAKDANGNGADRQASATSEPAWPTLAPEALHGLAGEIVRAIDPHTEADPVATLAHLLAGFGNLIGSSAHAKVQHDPHPARLDLSLVGCTAGGRKGTAWSTPRHLLARVDEAWARFRVKTGLSSGEGLIYHVRDAREEQQAIKERGRVIDYQNVIVDPGESDKRLFVIEPELATILKRMAGEGNTLSSVMREAWDSGNLSTLTKNSPMRATGAHVSIVAHVTREELLRHLDETERANGFANRFLWLLVRKSKNLPDGDAVPESILADLANKLGTAVTFARTVGEIKRNAEARELWHAVYPALSADKPGMTGAILSRAEAQVLRLSVLYALLDCSSLIRAAHLKAALAVWEFAEASARFIFGNSAGDPDADRIVRALQAQGPMSDTDLSDLFGRHRKASRIHGALDRLERTGRIVSEDVETAGRTKRVWRVAN